MSASRGMDVDDFWNLVELSNCETDSRNARVTWLVDELSRRPVQEIIDYHAWWHTTRNRGRTVDVYAAYWFVFGRGSPAGFEYFVSWLVSLGREPFEAVTNCPDRLVELPQVLRMLEGSPEEQERPEFELLGSVAYRAYEQVTGPG